MKFLVDQCLSVELATHLAAAGYDAVHVASYGLSRADDAEILARAATEDSLRLSDVSRADPACSTSARHLTDERSGGAWVSGSASPTSPRGKCREALCEASKRSSERAQVGSGVDATRAK